MSSFLLGEPHHYFTLGVILDMAYYNAISGQRSCNMGAPLQVRPVDWSKMGGYTPSQPKPSKQEVSTGCIPLHPVETFGEIRKGYMWKKGGVTASSLCELAIKLGYAD